MKKAFLTALLGTLFVLAVRDVQAQVYDAYYYWDGAQYQQYWPQQYDLYSYGSANQYPEQLYDPYYQLHVLHYQLYLPQNQAYFYSPCCVGGTVVVQAAAAPVRRFPRGFSPRAMRPVSLPPLPAAVTHSAPPIRIR